MTTVARTVPARQLRAAPPASLPLRRAVAEALEGRLLMTVVFEEVPYMGGTQLRVTGSAFDDVIAVSQTGSGLLIQDGSESYLMGGDYRSVRIDGGDGNDVITVDPSVTL